MARCNMEWVDCNIWHGAAAGKKGMASAPEQHEELVPITGLVDEANRYAVALNVQIDEQIH